MRPASRFVAIIALVWLSATLGACGAAKRHPAPIAVTKASFETTGQTWPLSVPTGSVGCSNGDEWWFEAHGVRYGLNEHASAAKGYAALEQIWDQQIISIATGPGSTPPAAAAASATTPGAAPTAPDAATPRELKQTPLTPQGNGLTALLALAQVLC